MNDNRVFKVFLIFLLAFFAVAFMAQILTSGGNVVGYSFRYLTPLAVVIGFMIPRFGFYLLLMAGAYLDLIKRFMILDSNFSDLDLAFLLGFAPALVAGMVLKFVIAVIMKSPTISRKDIYLFLITTALCMVLGGVQFIMAKGELRALGSGVNMVVYLYMPLIMSQIFKGREDIRKLLTITAIIYLPAALWAIQQSYFGLASFEMQYLLSGRTIEVRQLDEEVFRNMGTMVSAHALSMVASILVAALIIPVSWKKWKLTPKAWLNPLRILSIAVFMAGAYFTFSRTGWVCAGVAIIAFICLQNKFLTYTAFFTALAGVVVMYLSASFLLETQVMNTVQEDLFKRFGSTAEMRQMMVLGTLNARLDSMASFATDPNLWTPFGLAAAGSNYHVDWVHDILTEMLVLVGFVPLAFLVCGFLFGALVAFRTLYRMPRGQYRLMVTYFIALGLGIMSGAFSQGSMVLYFPINFFWCMFLGIAYCLIGWEKESRKQARAAELQQSRRDSLNQGEEHHGRPITAS